MTRPFPSDRAVLVSETLKMEWEQIIAEATGRTD